MVASTGLGKSFARYAKCLLERVGQFALEGAAWEVGRAVRLYPSPLWSAEGFVCIGDAEYTDGRK
jgi:hypothetical protein